MKEETFLTKEFNLVLKLLEKNVQKLTTKEIGKETKEEITKDFETLKGKLIEKKKVAEVSEFLKLKKEYEEMVEKYSNVLKDEYFYDFGYFFNEKDSGSIYIKTKEKIMDETFDMDEPLAYAYENQLIEKEYLDNILYVEEITELEAAQYGVL